MRTSLILAALAMTVMAGPCAAFEISSPAIDSNGTIPLKFTANRFGCTGRNISPPLAWKDVPAGTKSLAVTMFDPDAGGGRGFWHWLVVNLPPGTRALPEGAGDPGSTGLPKGAVEAMNDAVGADYFGPCPPERDPPHRYVITVFAVAKAKLAVDAHTPGPAVAATLGRHAIAKARVTYRYGR